MLKQVMQHFKVGANAKDKLLQHPQLSRILNEICETNRYYVAANPVELKKNISNNQAPVATLVMCCDSRAHTTSFTYKPENNFFIVRNIGNQYILNQGSVEYGISNLGTPLLIFLGHTQCGAIKASMSDYSELPSQLIREIDHLALSIKPSELDGTEEQQWHQAVINNVNKQVELALKDFGGRVNNGELMILGMVLDIDNTAGEGHGKILITNYNGNSNQDELKQIDLIKNFFE